MKEYGYSKYVNDLKDLWVSNYFIAVKLVYGLLAILYIMINSNGDSSMDHALELADAAVCASLLCIYETVRSKKIFLAFEALAVIASVSLFCNELIFLLPLVICDAVFEFNQPPYLLSASLLGTIYAHDRFTYIIVCIFTFIIYCQHYSMILKYRRSAQDYEQQEMNLKSSIEDKALEFSNQIRQTSLHYENIMLQDRARISQQLHDKLGHRINGSIYQLEACRAVAYTDMQKADEIMERVTDSLREGMDEVRSFLRQERPDGRRMALLQLNSLCEECRVQYGIEAELDITGDSGRIGEDMWGVIFDNCCEAVTNALKYSQCSVINIEINVLNKVLRCCVSDNGKGCEIIQEGMGLHGIKNRVGSLGGTVHISGSTGFTINMLMPIN